MKEFARTGRSLLRCFFVLGLVYASLPHAAPAFVELQRYSDQAVDVPRLTLISPDQAHFYVIGQTDIVGYALFPQGAVSPRVALVRGLVDGSRVSEVEEAVFSHDGRFLYLSRPGQIVVLARNASDGALDLAEVVGLGDFRASIAVSSDDRHLYVARADSLTRFARDPSTGLLTLAESTVLPGDNPSFATFNVAITSDDRTVLVTRGPNLLVVLDRDPGTGAVSNVRTLELAGNPMLRNAIATIDVNTVAVLSSPAIEVFRRDGADAEFSIVGTFPAMDLGQFSFNFLSAAVHASPEGSNAYITFNQPELGLLSFNGNGSITLGSLAALPEGMGFFGPVKGLAFTADGSRVLAAEEAGDRWALLDRDPPTGALSLAPDQIYDGVPDGTQGLGNATLVLSRDGSRLIALGKTDDLAVVFEVATDGRLVPEQTLAVETNDGNGATFADSADRFYAIDDALIRIWERDPLSGNWNGRPGTPAGLDPNNFRIPLYLVASDDARFLYVVWSLRTWGVSTFRIEVNGDLTPVNETIEFTNLGGTFPFNVLLSDDERFLYVQAFPIVVMRRDPDNGSLELIDQTDFRDFSTGAVALPGGDLVVSSFTGLSIFRHDATGQLDFIERLMDPSPDDFRGLLGTTRGILRLPGSSRYLHLSDNEANQHALLALDPAGRMYLERSVSPIGFSNATQGAAAASPDGRTLYVPSAALNAVTVHRIELLFGNSFERLQYGAQPEM